jgi:hypothetical protein
MPFFDQNPLGQLAFQPGDADAVLDLSGLEQEQAMDRVEALLGDPGNVHSYLILFERATADGGETLFLPLGRRLLAARRDGVLARCLPIAEGNGYYVAFTRPASNSDS